MKALLDAHWLRGLTLYRTQDGKWQANTTRDGVGWRVEIDDNPVVAVEKALGGEPPKPLSEIPTDETDIFS